MANCNVLEISYRSLFRGKELQGTSLSVLGSIQYLIEWFAY